MKPSSTTRTAVLAIAASFTPVYAASSRTAPAHTATTPWEKALHLREALAAEPESARTRAEYARAIEAFRIIYFGSARDQHAPASILAQANLEAEEGHLLHDAKATQSAATHYEFLRTQYPASSLVPAAILAQAQLEAEERHDPKAARTLYALLVHNHPRSEQAEAARVALRSPATLARAKAPAVVPEPEPARRVAPLTPEPTPEPVETSQAPTRHSGLPPMATTAELAARADTVPTYAQPRTTELPIAATPVEAPIPTHRPRAATVTGIRHWSTPTYTRVAIDLGDDVTFEAARVTNPSRLFFDLHGARLAPELINKTFAVTDDGFLQKIRAAQQTPDTTRVVLDVSDVTEYSAFLLPNPSRLIIDIHGKAKQEAVAAPIPATPLPVPAPRVAQPQAVTLGRPVPNTIATKTPTASAEIAAVSLQPGKIEATGKPTAHPIAATVPDDSPIATKRKHTRHTPDDDIAAPAKAAVPTATGETSLVRALGLKIGRIVIDAGHGGHDSGTLGAGGIQEKDVVLDVALRLGKLLHERLGAEIIYTRSDDTFIPLETRTAIANKAQADLFLSIHANSSPDPTARGVETYYLNFTQSADANQLAARENALSGQSVHQLTELVKKITLKDKIEESREFASDVETSLYAGLAQGNEGLRNRGVKKAPFVVLIGANMPSILAEISFVSNQRDAEQLRKPEYRQRVAESLFKGVAKYESGLGDSHAPLERASIATPATGK
ncbi:N-acetylmuramoyl-L-alanine amidase [Granulicella pectinivorans]|uniref:N-acetylmuramoyl-L-alanine amidase n=1 Tax=Granulicella pectinivorans TaxID=474950 RepID=A0A1I6L0V1_9BACT|nr:N-acetylmuramoyl-L-alanine amidase [Granulicella pectinivorans]SFR96918.1 N-acetylmuramoyl-L-alanine amidase [Granulicella pectinivorans]